MGGSTGTRARSGRHHRGILRLVVAASIVASSVVFAAGDHDALLVTEECYQLSPAGGDDEPPTGEIVATFSNPVPAEGDWMGIYPAGDTTTDGEPLGDPLAWSFLCGGSGDAYKGCEASRGSVSFAWAEAGFYEAVLIRDPYPPYRPYSESAAFRVATDCSSGGGNIFLRGGRRRGA